MEGLLDKYNDNVIKNIDKNNLKKIVKFLQENNCEYIDDILSDYLDLFMLNYEEFVNKYRALNNKYENKFLEKASENMNLLEEFYYI
ncbi:MAG: hypothetical protein IKF19_06890 [Bacilli bacterium]|nr:hypothetical protein [Bacilli bacterium]